VAFRGVRKDIRGRTFVKRCVSRGTGLVGDLWSWECRKEQWGKIRGVDAQDKTSNAAKFGTATRKTSGYPVVHRKDHTNGIQKREGGGIRAGEAPKRGGQALNGTNKMYRSKGGCWGCG